MVNQPVGRNGRKEKKNEKAGVMSYEKENHENQRL